MNREIKFRVWMPLIEDSNDLRGDMNYSPGWSGDLNTAFTSNHFKWMQYTGLKDKNGKEVYEGDIVEVLTWKRIVFFEKGRFVYKCSLDNHVCGVVDGNQLVIGNIYENPELL